MPSRQSVTIAVAITTGVLSTLGGLLGNIATSTIPPGVLPSLRFSWPALGIVSLLSVGLSVWQSLHDNTPPQAANMQSANLSLSSAAIENIACPFCHQKDLQIQGKGSNSMILECRGCGKFLRVVYEGDKLLKLVIPTVGVLVGVIEIAHFLRTDPDGLLNIIEGIFDSL